MKSSGETSRMSRFGYDACAMASLVLICAIIYANSLDNPLLRDDKTAVVNDRRANDPVHWRDIFTKLYWHGLNDDPIYRPLTTLSFLLNRMAAGQGSRGYRSVNIALHAGVCLAVYILAMRLLGGRLAAWLAAMLFAVHAVHNEAVTVIVGRADMAVTLLLVIVVWLLLGRTVRGGCEPWRWILVVVVSAVALFFKETAYAVLPLIVFVQVWQAWVHRSASVAAAKRRRYLITEVALAGSIALVCIAALGVRFYLFGRLSRPGPMVPMIDNPLGHATPVERVVTSIGLLGRYLRLLIWPDPLCCDYSYPQIPVASGLADRSVMIGLLWIVGLVVLLGLVKRYATAGAWHVAVWCLGFFVITYAMISNAFLVIGTIFGERLIYLPSVAVCLAFGAAAARLFARTRAGGRAALALACIAILSANAYLTLQRNRVWKDKMALWQHATKVSTRSCRAWWNLSKAYYEAGDVSKAIDYMQHAISLYADNWECHNLLGEQLARQGRFDEAAQAHLIAYNLTKGKLRVGPAFRLGMCYAETKELHSAIRAFQAVVALKPDHLGALNNLAYYLTHSDPPLRDLDAAARHIDKALALAPNRPTIVDTAVDVCLARGQRRRAIQLIEQTLGAANGKTGELYDRLRRRLAELTQTFQPTTKP